MTRRAAIQSTVRLQRDADYKRRYVRCKRFSYEQDAVESDQDAAEHGWDRAAALEAASDTSGSVAGEVVLAWLQQALSVLEPREALVLIRYYGLDGTDPQTGPAIGDKQDVSRTRIYQLRDKALRKLRRGFLRSDREIGAYLDEWITGQSETFKTKDELYAEAAEQCRQQYAEAAERERQRRAEHQRKRAVDPAYQAWLNQWLKQQGVKT